MWVSRGCRVQLWGLGLILGDAQKWVMRGCEGGVFKAGDGLHTLLWDCPKWHCGLVLIRLLRLRWEGLCFLAACGIGAFLLRGDDIRNVGPSYVATVSVGVIN